MNRNVENWDYAAEDAYSYLNERRREYPVKNALKLLDDLCMKGTVSQAELLQKHGHIDFIATILGHVTNAVHGKGSVPKKDGWYKAAPNPHTYTVHPLFAEAWKRKRKL